MFPLIHIGLVEQWRCQVQAWLEGPLSTCMYAIFLIKTHRVLSIFEARLPKVVHRQWILGSNLQLVGVLLLTLVQLIIVAIFVNIFSPSVEYMTDPELKKTYAQCKSDATADIIMSAYPTLLTILCFCFAFRARRLPENYGESRHILANMAVNLTVYFTSFGLKQVYQGKAKTIVGNVFLSVSPLAGLVLLFVPKVWIILIRPERNTVQELRRMTLAHMQRQSEFSPDTDGNVRGEERKKPGEDTRPKSLLRRGKSGSITNKHPNENGLPGNGSKKSIHSVDNGNMNSKKGNCEVNPSDDDGDKSHNKTLSKVPAVENSTDRRNVDLPQRKGTKHGLQKRSSSLFVIQILDDIEEKQNEESLKVRTVAGDHPLNFSLHESENEKELEGDMFVVSMLGRTLTLKVDDRDAVGIPQTLGGVYVGCKTNGTSCVRETVDSDPIINDENDGKQNQTLVIAKEQSEGQEGYGGKTCSDAQRVNNISAPDGKQELGPAVGFVDVFQDVNDANLNKHLSTTDTFETSDYVESPSSDCTFNAETDTNGKHIVPTINPSSQSNQEPKVPVIKGEKNAVSDDVWFEDYTSKIPQRNLTFQVGEEDSSSESQLHILEMNDILIQMELINPSGIHEARDLAENTKPQLGNFLTDEDTEL
ncbi:extracellular calcium-sensing receptor-like [Asterias rubens]|uniref:extracellular calcium-sensing receptor-like n=1 Tax=Asterias rubens TaxID=7604 RepID=UPI001455DAEF|nr:extracellular calcium-sensing receptor-like [Asterias rubens]